MTIKSKTSRAAITTSILIALLVVISTVPAGVLAQSGGETEPNDARATATPLQDSISGEIGVSGGVDWYSAQFTEGETVSFLVTKALSEPSLELSLYGPKGNKLDAENSWKHDRRIQVASTANRTGTYYVKVEASNTSKKEIPYVVRVLDQTATERSAHEESEPNDALAAATSLQNGYVRATLSGAGDVDWYSAEFTRGETVSFLMTGKQSNISEIELLLYFNGTKITSKVIGMDDTRAQIATIANQTGTYYIKIRSAYISSRINSSLAYTIRVAGQSAPPQTAAPPTTDTVTSQTATLTTQTATSPTTTGTATTGTQTSGTATSAQTGTSTSSGTSSSANTPVEEETTSMFGPGFTSVGAIIALLSGVLFTVRQR